MTDLLAAVAADLGPAEAEGLLTRYDEPHRAYHTRVHLIEAFAALRLISASPTLSVRLALWFHDAVYDPRRSDNEAASARLAAGELAMLGHHRALIARVSQLIHATATHRALPGDTAAACLLDADLWILSAPRPRYDRYVEQVRREYAHVPDDLFAAGRSALLRELVGRDELYATAVGRSWTPAARANIARELQRYPTGP